MTAAQIQTTHNLMESILTYLDNRRVAFSRRFVPYYICSAMVHHLNIVNDNQGVLYEKGRAADTRLHVFFCAPPGYMKTEMLMQLLFGTHAVFLDSPILTAYAGATTEAGFVGTIKVVDGQAIQQVGLAGDYSEHIIGIDEFSALTNVMRQDHSLNLDNAFLTALDSGHLYKRLALGELSYKTNLTLWSGSQPARFDLTSGLGRRFLFIMFIPTQDEKKIIKEARRRGKNILPDVNHVKQIHNLLGTKLAYMNSIKQITYDERIYEVMDKVNFPHYEEPLVERLALGYNLATREITPQFEVQVDDVLHTLIKRMKWWRQEIKRGAHESEIMQIIQEEKVCTLDILKERALEFGVTYAQLIQSLEVLRKQQRIAFKKSETGDSTIIVSLEKWERPLYD